MFNNKMAGHLVALFTVSVWGTTFISTKILLRQFTPAEILFMRISLALVALFLMNPKRMAVKSKRDELYFIGAGLTGLVMYFLCENIALEYGDASIICVIVSSAPLFAGILGAIFLKERITKGFLLGFIVAISGICLISLGDNGVRINLLGTALTLLAAMSWGIYSTLTHIITDRGYPAIGATKRVFAYAFIIMLSISAISGFRISEVLKTDTVAIANLLFLGLGASALCFLTWNFAVRTLGSTQTCVYIYFSPVITVVLAAAILKERMGLRAISGTMLVLAGLVISEWKRGTEREARHGSI